MCAYEIGWNFFFDYTLEFILLHLLWSFRVWTWDLSSEVSGGLLVLFIH